MGAVFSRAYSEQVAKVAGTAVVVVSGIVAFSLLFPAAWFTISTIFKATGAIAALAVRLVQAAVDAIKFWMGVFKDPAKAVEETAEAMESVHDVFQQTETGKALEAATPIKGVSDAADLAATLTNCVAGSVFKDGTCWVCPDGTVQRFGVDVNAPGACQGDCAQMFGPGTEENLLEFGNCYKNGVLVGNKFRNAVPIGLKTGNGTMRTPK